MNNQRILVICYSQSGDTIRCVESLLEPLRELGVGIYWEHIVPKADYPYPWQLNKFLDVFPECLNEEPPEIEPLSVDPNISFDLVILAYPVWYLAPSLPIQGFLKSPYAELLRGKKVIGLISCRHMWYSAAQTMKRLLDTVGASQIDNVVVTYQGPPLATFISTPRRMLTGKKDRTLGILPPGSFSEQAIADLAHLGRHLAQNLYYLDKPTNQSLLKPVNKVEVKTSYVIAELIGKALYQIWASLIRKFGRQGSWQRQPILFVFALNLVLVLPAVLLIATIVDVLFGSWYKMRINSRLEMLISS